MATGWIDQRESDFAKVRSEAMRQAKAALEAAGIALPDPRYEVRIDRSGDDAPASRASEVRRRRSIRPVTRRSTTRSKRIAPATSRVIFSTRAPAANELALSGRRLALGQTVGNLVGGLFVVVVLRHRRFLRPRAPIEG